jgi:hypothetical protein
MINPRAYDDGYHGIGTDRTQESLVDLQSFYAGQEQRRHDDRKAEEERAAREEDRRVLNEEMNEAYRRGREAEMRGITPGRARRWLFLYSPLLFAVLYGSLYGFVDATTNNQPNPLKAAVGAYVSVADFSYNTFTGLTDGRGLNYALLQALNVARFAITIPFGISAAGGAVVGNGGVLVASYFRHRSS